MSLIRLFTAALVLTASWAATGSAQEDARGRTEPPATEAGSAGATLPPPEGAPLLGQPAADAAPEVDPFGSGFSRFGGSGGFEGFIGFGPRGEGAQARYVASQEIMVTWSEKFDTAWGFSKTTGKWTRQELDPPAAEPPTVGQGLGVIQAGSAIYAYSGRTGRWDVLRLPKDHKPQFAIQQDFVVVHDGSDIYTFADAAGRWTSPDGENVNENDPDQGGGGSYASGEEYGANPYARPASPPPSELRRSFEELDSQAAKVAEQYRSKAATLGPKHPELLMLKQQLTAAVKAAFQARQQLHQAELAEFQRRIQDVRETIEARNRIQDDIIQRRVNELLDPSLRWDAGTRFGGAGRSTSVGQTTPPIGGTSPGVALPGPPSISSLAPATPVTETAPASRRPHRELGQMPDQLAVVGVISQAGDPDEIVISSAQLGGIREGEELLVIRNDQFAGDQLVGMIKIINANQEVAIGRLLVTRRVLNLNRYEADRLQAGDKVARVKSEAQLRIDAAREKSANNLKRLMLAMHNYHDTYNRFPPAVILGKDGRGGTAHSWRVELLPFLEKADLYNQYRFDEPWDSEHNKSLLAKMPEVFRSPLDKPDSTHASYFALVTPSLNAEASADTKASGVMVDLGAAGGVLLGGLDGASVDWSRGTVFSNPRGTSFAQILDGTSNTIALVEAKRNIPWTQPHDLVYVADQALPVLGGWFPDGWHAGLGDGSVRFLSADTDEATLRALFTIGGGEIVDWKRVEAKNSED